MGHCVPLRVHHTTCAVWWESSLQEKAPDTYWQRCHIHRATTVNLPESAHTQKVLDLSNQLFTMSEDTATALPVHEMLATVADLVTWCAVVQFFQELEMPPAGGPDLLDKIPESVWDQFCDLRERTHQIQQTLQTITHDWHSLFSQAMWSMHNTQDKTWQ